MKKITFLLVVLLGAGMLFAFEKAKTYSREYKVIENRDYATFSTKVTDALTNGYALAGGVAFNYGVYYQAVYK